MAQINPLHEGVAYGIGQAATGGLGAVQCVKVTDDGTFAPGASSTVPIFGINKKATAEGENPTIYCNGGIYETDTFIGDLSAGDKLACDAETSLLKEAEEGNFQVASAMSVDGGILRFKLLV